jgi:nucleobase:cation symporter-1, NCS1 family
MATRDQDVIQAEAEAGVLVREGSYGSQVMTVEPGGTEFIPLNERHGRPPHLFWVWTSPNMEFATIFVGVLAVAGFGLSFWAAALAVILGSGVGGLGLGVLSLRGPVYGVPQMVLSRLGFGYWGNALPAGLNAVVAGIGWFAVNSVSGAFALNVLTHLPKVLCLLIVVVVQVVVAFFGYNLIHLFERYAFPVLTVVFLIACVVVLSKAHPGAVHHTIPGGFLLAFGASFGYAAAWNACASDYSRYLSPSTSKAAIAWWAGLGLFLSCALLEIVGAAAGTVVSASSALGSNPTGAFTALLASPLADLTLLCIALGAVSANVLNIYSGTLSFVAVGISLPLSLRRAIVTLGFGTIGFFLAWSGLRYADTKYRDFLLIIAYWIAPWLAVTFCDLLLRRNPDEALLFATRRTNWAGPVAMAVGAGISIWLFSNQTKYLGLVPRHVPAFGDLTLEAGFLITAAIYLGWHALAGTGRENTLADAAVR